MPVKRVLLASGILASSFTASIADDRLEARQVAQSVVASYTSAYDKHDPKAISMLFVPDEIFLPANGDETAFGV